MSDVSRMLHDMTDRLFGEECTASARAEAEHGEWPARLWQQIEEIGLTVAAIPESEGGAGASLADTMVIMRGLGRHAVPLPLAEDILARWLLTGAGVDAGEGPLTVATVDPSDSLMLSRRHHGWSLRGRACAVPWARNAQAIVAVANLEEGRQTVVSVPMRDCDVLPAANVAGEPRDEVVFKDVCVAELGIGQPSHVDRGAALMRFGALARCHQMTGAMEWILERSCEYVRDRNQFGRPIGGFQVVQHLLAVMAGQVSAAATAADAAEARLLDTSDDQAVGYAKARVGSAAGEVAALAHQVHGAMGYSYEYPLHFRTRRLWAWRDEFGSERFWQIRTGCRIASRGADALWRDLTG